MVVVLHFFPCLGMEGGGEEEEGEENSFHRFGFSLFNLLKLNGLLCY